jgi:hypothetical protein
MLIYIIILSNLNSLICGFSPDTALAVIYECRNLLCCATLRDSESVYSVFTGSYFCYTYISIFKSSKFLLVFFIFYRIKLFQAYKFQANIIWPLSFVM